MKKKIILEYYTMHSKWNSKYTKQEFLERTCVFKDLDDLKEMIINCEYDVEKLEEIVFNVGRLQKKDILKNKNVFEYVVNNCNFCEFWNGYYFYIFDK